jgi:hypothetical protein
MRAGPGRQQQYGRTSGAAPPVRLPGSYLFGALRVAHTVKRVWSWLQFANIGELGQGRNEVDVLTSLMSSGKRAKAGSRVPATGEGDKFGEKLSSDRRELRGRFWWMRQVTGPGAASFPRRWRVDLRERPAALGARVHQESVDLVDEGPGLGPVRPDAPADKVALPASRVPC